MPPRASGGGGASPSDEAAALELVGGEPLGAGRSVQPQAKVETIPNVSATAVRRMRRHSVTLQVGASL